MRRRVLSLVVLVGIGFAFASFAPAFAVDQTEYYRVRFNESSGPSANQAYGVHAQYAWNYSPLDNGDNVPCAPPSVFGANWVDSLIRGQRQNGNYIQFGPESQRIGSDCQKIWYIIASWEGTSGPDVDLYNADPATGTRQWAINRLPGGTNSNCSSAYNYCWYFRISDLSGTVLLEDAKLGDAFNSFNDLVRVAGVCAMASAGSCHSTVTYSGAPREMSSLSWKKDNGNWIAWAGQDGACADHSANADGKWVSDDDIKLGFNSSMSGSITGGC